MLFFMYEWNKIAIDSALDLDLARKTPKKEKKNISKPKKWCDVTKYQNIFPLANTFAKRENVKAGRVIPKGK